VLGIYTILKFKPLNNAIMTYQTTTIWTTMSLMMIDCRWKVTSDTGRGWQPVAILIRKWWLLLSQARMTVSTTIDQTRS
jgi:hypothetical protein